MCDLLSLVNNEQLVGVSLKPHTLNRYIVGSDEIGVFLAEYLKCFRHKLLVRDAVFCLECHKKRVGARAANFSYYLRSGRRLQLARLFLSRDYFSASRLCWSIVAWC